MMTRVAVVGVLSLAAVGALGSTALGEPPSRWVHVKVEAVAPEKETVRINIPVALVSDLLPLIDQGKFHRGHIALDSLSIRGVDLPKMVEAIRGAEDGEYVTVESEDETVRVTKKEGRLHIRVHEMGERPEDVEIQVRMDVLAALTSGEPGELDVASALEALREDEAEIITVHEADESVRIWIDAKPTAE